MLEKIKELRERTNIGLGKCKAALEDSNGDVEKAIKLLQERGALKAQDISSRATNEGRIVTYTHPGSQLVVVLEVNCQTDFAAKSPAFIEFAENVAMHIAGMKPQYKSRNFIPTDVMEDQVAIIFQELEKQMKNKPDNIKQKIADGKLNKWIDEVCLSNQKLLDTNKTVEETRTELVAKLGENVSIGRWIRWEVGKND